MDPGETVSVLVVDDDEAIADLYASQLSDSYDVVTAYDGETALELMTEEIDVVLLDRRMHDLSGQEVLAATRERDLTCAVVMVTAVDPDFDILEMGFDEYLLKPVKRDELQSVVSETLERLDHREAEREYLALASKLSTLRLEKNHAELESSDEYDRLVDRLEELEAEVDPGELDAPVDV